MIAAPGPLPPREKAVTDIFTKVSPSVVNVFDTGLLGRVISSLSTDMPEGNGTGVLLKDGLILTNYHVLETSLDALPPNADIRAKPIRCAKVTVNLPDGPQAYTAVLVGCDKTRDLAVLKLEAAPVAQLVPAIFGASADLRVGQQVFSIGNPFGFTTSLSAGVISALNRDIYSRTGSVISGGIRKSSSSAQKVYFSVVSHESVSVRKIDIHILHIKMQYEMISYQRKKATRNPYVHQNQHRDRRGDQPG